MKTLVTISYTRRLVSGNEVEACVHKYLTDDTFASDSALMASGGACPLRRHLFSVMKSGIIVRETDEGIHDEGYGFTIPPHAIQRIDVMEVPDDFDIARAVYGR